MVVVISGADMKNPAPAGVFVSAGVALQLLRQSGYRFHVVDDNVFAVLVEAHELSPAVGEAFLNETLWGVRGRYVDGIALCEVGTGGLVTVVVGHGIEERVLLGGRHLIERCQRCHNGVGTVQVLEWYLKRTLAELFN